MNLKGKVIVITGGGRGIGREIGKVCADAGARVILAARSQADLDESKALFPCETVKADVTDAKALAGLMKTAGSIDGLVCAAGIYGTMGPFVETPFDEWAKAIEINLLGTARTVHAAYPHLKKGSRVVLFSGGGQGSMNNFSAYTTSKGGIWRLTETLGGELLEKGIYLNAIAPGAVNTKLLDELLEAGPDKVGKEVYEKSLQQKKSGGTSPKKAADLVLWLLGPQSEGLAGKTLSAVWDPYPTFQAPDLMKSEIFTFRRVVKPDGGTRA